MDSKRIYRKTPLGEEALRDRAQLKSGRLRAVLIMVDGQASVGELHLRLGRKQRPDDRLSQLERLGFIEPIPQSRRSRSARAAAQTPPVPAEPAASVSPATEPPPAPGPESGPAPAEPSAEDAASKFAAEEPPVPYRLAEPGADQAPVEVAEANFESPPSESPPPPDLPPAADVAAPPPEALPAPAGPAEGSAPSQGASGAAASPGGPLDDEPAGAAVAAFPRGAQPLAAKLRALLARRPGRGPAAGGRRSRLPGVPRVRLLPVLAVFVLALVLAGAILPQRLRPDLEREAARRIGQPVRIERVALTWQPRFGLYLEGVAAGERGTARAARVVVSPSLHGMGDLLEPRVDLQVSGLTLEGEAIAALCAVAGIDADAARKSRIDAVVIDDLTLNLPQVGLAGLHGHIGLDPARGAPQVSLAGEGERLRAQIMPAPRGCRFAATGSGWHPPQLPGLAFDALTATGTVDERMLRIERFDARTSEGLIAGSGSLTWQPRAILDLRIELQHLDLARLMAALGLPPAARGELDARLHFSASATVPDKLAAALTVGGPVTLSRGAIERFDVVEAARNPGTDRIHGGALRFEQLSAQLHIERGAAALHGLRLSAGALSADGSLAVGRDSALSGSLSARLKGAAGEIHVPLHVAGSLAAPELGAGAGKPAAAVPPEAEQ